MKDGEKNISTMNPETNYEFVVKEKLIHSIFVLFSFKSHFSEHSPEGIDISGSSH